MPIKKTGPLQLQEIRAEFGGAAPDALEEYFAGGPTGYVPAGTTGINGTIPAPGSPISFDDFYGAPATVDTITFQVSPVIIMNNPRSHYSYTGWSIKHGPEVGTISPAIGGAGAPYPVELSFYLAEGQTRTLRRCPRNTTSRPKTSATKNGVTYYAPAGCIPNGAIAAVADTATLQELIQNIHHYEGHWQLNGRWVDPEPAIVTKSMDPDEFRLDVVLEKTGSPSWITGPVNFGVRFSDGTAYTVRLTGTPVTIIQYPNMPSIPSTQGIHFMSQLVSTAAVLRAIKQRLDFDITISKA